MTWLAAFICSVVTLLLVAAIIGIVGFFIWLADRWDYRVVIALAILVVLVYGTMRFKFA